MKFALRLIYLMLCLLLSTTCYKASAGTQYFSGNGYNSQTGSTIGLSVSGYPQQWDARLSQYNGYTASDTSLVFGAQVGANWTFVWTRQSGDTSAYTVVPVITVNTTYNARVVMQYGFDNVYNYTQVPWPNGYWVDNSSNWTTLATSGSTAGTYTLNSGKTAINIPSSANSLYVRIYLLDPASSGTTDITSGSIQFTQLTYQVPPVNNVLTFGADPTGVNDSTAAIQNAVNAGGEVVIPPGHYLISKTIYVRKSNTDIEGEIGSVLQLASTASVDGIDVGQDGSLWTQQNVNISGLTIANSSQQYIPGNDMNYTSGISYNGVQCGIIKDCTVTNFQEQGIKLVDVHNIQVEGCTLNGARHGIGVDGNEWIGANGTSDIQIDRCHTINTWDTGIAIGINSAHTKVSNCIIENSAAHGMDIFNCSDITVTGNTIRDWNGNVTGMPKTGESVGIFVHPDWGVTVAVPTRNITITGNLVIYDLAPASGVTPISMEVTGNVDGVTITGNTLIGSWQALDVDEQPYNSTYANRVDQTPASDPQAPQNVIFSNNVCRAQSGQEMALTTTSLAITATLSNNMFTPASGANFLFSLTTPGDIVMDNNVFQSASASQSMLSGMVASGNTFLPSPNDRAQSSP